MSHVDSTPLATYNSLLDPHLAGYFSNTKMRKHLKKSGLITRRGEIVSENTYRLQMARREHKNHVKDLLAQAIVHKTLDLERGRQVQIRRKLEEIAKIELVRRVRSDRGRKGDEELLPYLSPRVTGKSSRTSYSKKDETDDKILYVRCDGVPVQDAGLEYPNEEIDSKHLYALDQHALQEYTRHMDEVNRGKTVESPYVQSQLPKVPSPPRTARSQNAGASSGRRRQLRPIKKETSLYAGEGPKKHQVPLQTMCPVTLQYTGENIKITREIIGDPRQEILVEQQHCGGNTLVVYKGKVDKGENFTFISHRHQGYPFSLTLYIDGIRDSRVSTCCEFKHLKGVRLGSKQGHFIFIGAEGASPCYKCQVDKVLKEKQKKKKKQKEVVEEEPEEEEEKVEDVEEEKEEETVVVPVQDDDDDEPETVDENQKILIPVEDDDNDDVQKETISAAAEPEDNYDDDFEDDDQQLTEEKTNGPDNENGSKDSGSSNVGDPYGYTSDEFEKDDKQAFKSNNETVIVEVHESDEEEPEPLAEPASELHSENSRTDADENKEERIPESHHTESDPEPISDVPDEGEPRSNSSETSKLTKSDDNIENTESIAENEPKKSNRSPSPASEVSDSQHEATPRSVSSIEESGSSSSSSESEPSTPRNETLKGDALSSSEVTEKISAIEENITRKGTIKPIIDGKTEVDLNGMALDKDQIEELAFEIESRADITQLHLRNCNIDDAGIARISEAIRKSPSTIKMLNLNLNEITSKGINDVNKIIAEKPQLEILLLHKNPIGDSGVALLIDVIEKNQNDLKALLNGSTLSLSSTTTEGSETISEVHSVARRIAKDIIKDALTSESLLELNESEAAGLVAIKQLDLGDTEITNKGCEDIARLITLNTKLEVLTLTGNTRVSPKGWLKIGSALSGNNRLRSIAVDYCDMKDEGLEGICWYLSKIKYLKSIDFEANDITDSGAQYLLEKMKGNDSICEINLKLNDVSSALMREIEISTKK